MLIIDENCVFLACLLLLCLNLLITAYKMKREPNSGGTRLLLVGFALWGLLVAISPITHKLEPTQVQTQIQAQQQGQFKPPAIDTKTLQDEQRKERGKELVVWCIYLLIVLWHIEFLKDLKGK